MSRKWQSLAELQQQATSAIEPLVPETVESVEPPEKINDTGREAVTLLKRWRANNNDDGAAAATLLAVFGTNSPIGRMMVRWTPIPAHLWLVEIAHANGARLADMGERRGVLRSAAAAEMIRRRIEPGSRLKPMGFETHAALLGYWRERRELLHALRALGMEKNANRTGRTLYSVESLVRRLEDLNVRIMSRGEGR